MSRLNVHPGRNLVTTGALLVILACAVLLPQWSSDNMRPRDGAADRVPARSAAYTDHDVRKVLEGQPIAFFENAGQAGSDIRFHAEAVGHTVLFRTEGIQFYRRVTGDDGRPVTGNYTIRFGGARPSGDIVGIDKLPGTNHFYRGPDPSAWATGVASFAGVPACGTKACIRESISSTRITSTSSRVSSGWSPVPSPMRSG
jgi:hypothetical protein